MAGSAVIGSLRANLTLNSAQFAQGAQRARQTMDRLGLSMGGLRNAALALKGVLAGLAVVAMANAKEIQIYSRMMGTTVEEFQRWAYAAKTVGLEQEQLGDIFKDFQEKTGEFLSTGGGGMKDFFEQIAPKVGVTAEQFKNLSGPQSLQLYLDTLQKAGVSQRAASFYLESMGSEATRLVPLLWNASSALNALGEEAEKNGAILSGQQIADLARVQDAWSALTSTFVGFASRIAATIAPALESILRGITALFAPGGALNTLFMGIANNLERLGHYAFVAVAGFTAYKVAVIAAQAATVSLSVALGFLKVALIRSGIGIAIVAAGELAYRFSVLSEKTGSTAEAARIMGRVFQAVLNAMVAGVAEMANRNIAIYAAMYTGIVKIFSKLPEALAAIFRAAAATATEGMYNSIARGTNTVIDAINGQLAKVSPKLALTRQIEMDLGSDQYIEDARATLVSAGTEIRDSIQGAFNEGLGTITAPKVFDVGSVREEWAEMQRVMKSGGQVARETAEDFTHLQDSIYVEPDKEKKGAARKLAKDMKDAGDATKEAAREATAAERAFETLRDGMAGVFSSIVTGADSARNAVGQFLKQLANTVASHAFTTFFNSTAMGRANGGFGNVLSWLGLGVGANANGTPNWRGGLTMVGERGPELVNLPRGSKVMDAQRTARAAAAGGTTRMVVEASPDLVVRILEQAKGQAIDITRAGLGQFQRDVLPRAQQSTAQDPRRRG